MSPKSNLSKLMVGLFRKEPYPSSNNAVDQNDVINFSTKNISLAGWALDQIGSTYPGLTDEQKGRLRQAISIFIQTPEFTIGHVMKSLSADFDEQTAELVAITEITRAYGYKAQKDGESRRSQFPDVPVEKTWFTNNDDRVCPICRGLHGKTVDIDQSFSEGVFLPPAHAGCRCWMSSRTNILRAKY
jgi:SPP1 gp7 family putative phage head morphogenesis protein